MLLSVLVYDFQKMGSLTSVRTSNMIQMCQFESVSVTYIFVSPILFIITKVQVKYFLGGVTAMGSWVLVTQQIV
jgi:hypothetical protein